MPLISQSIDHLLGGVSQRPALQRSPEQLALGDNVFASSKYGLMKRPALEYKQKLTGTITDWMTAFIHPIERDANEKQRMVIVGGVLKVYDTLTGSELTVRDRTSAFAYLSGTTKASDFRARTVGDSTFIVNRTKTPAMSSAFKSPENQYEALVYVRQGEYSTPYAIYLNDRPAVYITPDASTAVSGGEITTDDIAKQLKAALEESVIVQQLFEVTRFRSSLYIRRKFPNPGKFDFDIKVSDGLAGEGLRVIKGEIQSIEDLPRYAKTNMRIKVVGEPGTDTDDFWLIYSTDNTPEDGGVWIETVAPGSLLKFDPATMPHQLVRKGSLFPKTAGTILAVEPVVTQSADDTVVETGFDEKLDDTSVTDDDIVIRDDADGRQKDVGGDGTERVITVAYDIDTALLDAGADVDVVLYRWTGAVATELSRKTYTPGKTVLQDTQKITTSVFAAGDKLRIVLEYQQDTAPTTLANQATLTLQKSTTPVSTAPLLDDAVRPVSRWLPPINFNKYRSAEVTYLTTATYPEGAIAEIKLDSTTTFSYTLGAGEGATEIASNLATTINAHASYVATNPSTGVVKIQTASGTTFPVVDTRTYMPVLIFYSSILNLVTNEFAGKTLQNVNDGSSGTIASNTSNTVTVSGLSGGKDNEIRAGDVCFVEEAGTYFVFDELDYGARDAGDETTNPEPSFIGEPINDVFFYENRLGFTAGESLIFSASGDLFSFWRTTVVQLLDDDRIDVQSAHAEVGVIHSVVQWNNQLYGWAENVQFKISGKPALGPRTIRIDTASRYFNTDRFRPIVAGQRLFFLHNKETNVQVQAYPPPSEDAPDIPAVRDLSIETPSYIPGKILDAVADGSLGLLAVLADGDQQNLFVYSWTQSPQGGKIQLLQEAWQKWVVPAGCEVLSMEFSAGSLAVILKRADGIFLCDIDLDISVEPDTSERVKYVDLRVTQATTSPTYAANKTTWTLPYSVNVDQTTEGEVVVWRADTFAKVTVARSSATTVETAADEDLSAVNVYIGIAYTMTAELSTIYERDVEGKSKRTGRMQVRYIEVNFLDTTDFKVRSTLAGTSRQYTTALTAQNPGSGFVHHVVLAKNEDATLEIIQDSAGGCRISSIDWEGFSHRRHRRAR